jgi:hypothetical protein
MRKPINPEDREALHNGKPPTDPELIEYLTVTNPWLDIMKSYCLEQVISGGGSKVKILYGGADTGKSHYLKDLMLYARRNGFFTISLDLSELEFHLTDSVAFYKAVVMELDLDILEKVLTTRLLVQLGYDATEFANFGGPLTDYLCEMENIDKLLAKKLIRQAVHELVNDVDLEFSFRKFLHAFAEAVVEKDDDFKEIAAFWIRGEKIPMTHRRASSLYETLAKHNARGWLYSLIELVKFMGFKGMVITMDQFEAILPKCETGIYYTPTKRNDLYELLRQLIDDLDFMRGLLVLIAGDAEIMNADDKYGLRSYHALWMRIQPGFEQQPNLNIYADLVDADMIFRDLRGSGELGRLEEKIDTIDLDIYSDKSGPEWYIDPEYGNFRDVLNKRHASAESRGIND